MKILNPVVTPVPVLCNAAPPRMTVHSGWNARLRLRAASSACWLHCINLPALKDTNSHQDILEIRRNRVRDLNGGTGFKNGIYYSEYRGDEF